MAKTRKTEKTVEIHEVVVIRQTSGGRSPLCLRCATSDAVMVTPERAAAIASVPVRTIYWWVENNMIHYQEESDGSLVVCVRSMPTTLNPEK